MGHITAAHPRDLVCQLRKVSLCCVPEICRKQAQHIGFPVQSRIRPHFGSLHPTMQERDPHTTDIDTLPGTPVLHVCV